MDCACIDGADSADGVVELLTTTKRKARKTHKCVECSGDIMQGQYYEHSKYLWEGEWFEDKTCPACLEIRNEYFCSWMSGCIWDELKMSDFDLSLPDFEALSVPAQIKYIDMML